MFRKSLFAATLVAMLSVPTVASAQESLALTTSYPGLAVDPGSSVSFDLDLVGPPGITVDLAVEGLPRGWAASFRAAGSTITRATTNGTSEESEPVDVRLEVDVPADAVDGDYEITAQAAGRSASSAIPLVVRVQAGATGGITLSPDFPGLIGPTDETFSFEVTVRNDSPAEVRLDLEGTGPAGWDVTARPVGSSQASVVTIDAGASQIVDLDATPRFGEKSGLYEVGMKVTGDGVDEALTLQVQLIGEPSLTLTTPDQRLNADVEAGSTVDFPVVLLNTGTASLTGIELSATPPSGWEVDFDPPAVPQLGAGESLTVTATITASEQAIAGDYDLAMSAESDLATDSMNIRTTVNPSGFWGLVGVGIVVAAIVALAAVFRVFGRR